jgi:DNA-binding CsgD family transcriptional regulator
MECKSTRPRIHDGPDITHGGSNPYSSWGQVAAYFDGDGSVSTRVRTFTLTFSLEFAESYLPQLLQIRDFLSSERIYTRPIKIQRRSEHITNYVLTVYTQQEVLLVCKKMLPFVFKKEWDLQTTVDYLEDRITGDEAIRRLNLSIESGRREGLVRKTSIPFRKTEGINMAALIGGRRSSASRAKLSKEQVEALRHIREKSGKSYAELARMFKVSLDVVRVALGRK